MQTADKTVRVGILSAEKIVIDLGTGYTGARGLQQFTATAGGRLLWHGREYDSIQFDPLDRQSRFMVKDVVIGVNFHWERREDQVFAGSCRLIIDEHGQPTLVNIIDIEDYLLSVISSEMSATASLNLLKAHAVISRSWLLAQIHNHGGGDSGNPVECDTPGRLVRWYDHKAHTLFDVCADDHCQRYQGVARQTTETVVRAIAETTGEVLTYNGQLCDARFSKCCGGVFEEFENCWEPVHHPYLTARRDSDHPLDFSDLRLEANARQWIESQPDAYCNTHDPEILGQVLNGYDQETPDFYRWRVDYTQAELSDLIRRRSGIDFGDILDLQPLERGTSGRLISLRIVGSKHTREIGKELEIRRTLSESHLYSSAFTVERHNPGSNGVPTGFTLRGAGWGHGVGLCQIGAAVMGARGIDYRHILAHYFPGSEITHL